MAGTAVGRARSQRAGCSNARPKSRAIALEVRILDRLACLPRRGGGGLEERGGRPMAASTVRPAATTATLFEPPPSPLRAAPLFTRPSVSVLVRPRSVSLPCSLYARCLRLFGRQRRRRRRRRRRRWRSNSTSVCMNTLYSGTRPLACSLGLLLPARPSPSHLRRRRLHSTPVPISLTLIHGHGAVPETF